MLEFLGLTKQAKSFQIGGKVKVASLLNSVLPPYTPFYGTVVNVAQTRFGPRYRVRYSDYDQKYNPPRQYFITVQRMWWRVWK